MITPTDHRPWPPPAGPWIMAQSWHDLLFAHWPVPVAALRPLVPAAIPLDTFGGRAWVGVIPFHMTGVRPRGVPSLPGLSAFPELNVRTYVTVGDKPGVYFFSLDARNALAVAAARLLFRLPYYRARMAAKVSGDGVGYRSRRTHAGAPAAELVARYGPRGLVFRSAAGSLDHWLTERYCLYTTDAAGRPYRAEIHHAPWPLQPAHATFERNGMAAAAGIGLPDTPPLLHFVRRLDVVVWPLARV
ncbi:MAG: YqjF family protein [Candidatus Rokuibacteriota bacterium]